MRTIALRVSNERFEAIERAAAEAGLDSVQFLTGKIDLLLEQSERRPHDHQWMSLERWEALLRGEGCTICGDLAENLALNHHGYLVADLRNSRLRLMHNQFVPGYCVLFSKQHVREHYHLSDKDRDGFFDDLTNA